MLTHGNVVSPNPTLPSKNASMEPCVLTHGNNGYALVDITGEKGFNGAMRVNAWKCHKSSLYRLASFCFNGAMRVNAWK